MEILDAAKWVNGQLLEICLALVVLCLGIILFAKLFALIIKHWKLSLSIFVACGFGYGYYKYIEQRTMEKDNQLREIHKQCFANCHSENYYLDLFTLQDFHDNIMWNDSTNNGNEKIYKTYFYPEDGNMGGVEIKSSFNKIYYYSYEIFMNDYNKNFFEENGFMKIEEDNTENVYVEPQTPEQAVENVMRDCDKKMTHLYKKDNITIKINLFYISEYYTCPMCKVEVYNNKMERLINII